MRIGPGAVACALLLTRDVVAQAHESHVQVPGFGLELTAFGQYIHTSGLRSAYQFGSVNRLMLHTYSAGLGGAIRLRAMASAEPLTLTARGAPQPLQVSFTSEGETVTDRAHPAPWLMELSASYERMLGRNASIAVYGAAIGEAALGPPVYAHRGSSFGNLAVPLGHHAQDITHSSYGVVTLGVRKASVQLELSAFNDRQPEEVGTVFYYEGARLDSYAGRATLVTRGGAELYGFYGYLPAASGGHDHGALHRYGIGVTREGNPLAWTLLYSANDPLGERRPANTLLMEGSWRSLGGHALFVRAEYVQRTDEELALIGSVNELQDVESVQVGYSRAIARLLRVGAYTTVNLVPPQLEQFYGTRTPLTAAAFGQIIWNR